MFISCYIINRLQKDSRFQYVCYFCFLIYKSINNIIFLLGRNDFQGNPITILLALLNDLGYEDTLDNSSKLSRKYLYSAYILQ